MSPRNLKFRIAALGLAVLLALPAAALARSRRAAEPNPGSPVWTWFARLLAGVAAPVTPDPPARAGARGLTSTWEKAGSTVDPDGRKTALVGQVEPPVKLPAPEGTGGGETR